MLTVIIFLQIKMQTARRSAKEQEQEEGTVVLFGMQMGLKSEESRDRRDMGDEIRRASHTTLQ